ncbi:hypothetical protein EVAR_18657_1 [Eumeta japonica]|uniref:Uncharacterized protein n=1 Tax=Eumeta variegata TaxID=151549 RepID=A0A4C1U830_EUMVA|nr:hypothetical protein EVAR_18657_1 [Eumeta japonica]
MTLYELGRKLPSLEADEDGGGRDSDTEGDFFGVDGKVRVRRIRFGLENVRFVATRRFLSDHGFRMPAAVLDGCATGRGERALKHTSLILFFCSRRAVRGRHCAAFVRVAGHLCARSHTLRT